MKTIRDRLNNWAKWSRGAPAKGTTSNTAFICDRMRVAAMGELHAPSGTGDRLDSVDAANVERAWKTLLPKHRDLLRWHYIRNATPGFICRRMGIKPRPTSVFDIELARSEAAIAQALTAQAAQTSGSGEGCDMADETISRARGNRSGLAAQGFRRHRAHTRGAPQFFQSIKRRGQSDSERQPHHMAGRGNG